MRMNMILMSVALGLAGCGTMKQNDAPESAASVAPPGRPVIGAGASAAALDQTTAAERAAAAAAKPTGGERALGAAVVALGSPAEQGLWVKSPLVVAPGKGRVVTESGASVAVDLLPGSGAASLSLAAFRALGLGLTDLPEVTIFAQ
ncbi:hypothetical protein [Cypionkella sp.]|uniref:hypothetical protein n=1 Tax=Cypionkella sp. TaxID=2811411 RepID=UPI00262799EB|nr:hypothetical protein [Cypionkella sp.]